MAEIFQEIMKNGKLYIVPTPIGNLADMTFRAVAILKKVKLIGAEDTRNSLKLMKHYEIETPLFSNHKFNERSRVEKIINHLRQGDDIAIISDAGMPGISDPASIIIQAAISGKIEVEVLPGATAFLPALVASGFAGDRFIFAGFIPNKESERNLLLDSLKGFANTLIFYEAPHRIEKTLKSLLAVFGDREVTIARELTKLHETFYRGRLEDFVQNPAKLIYKGEFVIVLAGAASEEIAEPELIKLLNEQLAAGKTKKNAVQIVSQLTGAAKNKIYDLVLKL